VPSSIVIQVIRTFSAAIFKVFTAVKIQVVVFWVMMPRSVVVWCQSFGGPCCPLFTPCFLQLHYKTPTCNSLCYGTQVHHCRHSRQQLNFICATLFHTFASFCVKILFHIFIWFFLWCSPTNSVSIFCFPNVFFTHLALLDIITPWTETKSANVEAFL
jgi:hypothetical protein